MTAIEFSAFIDRLATVSGEAILPFFRTALTVDDKSAGGIFDPVTAADRAGELAMRALIRDTFPSHGVVGEEFGADKPDAEYVWVLDPIDGTKSFIAGMPAWGTLIALTRHGHPVFGMMHQPFFAERFSGDGILVPTPAGSTAYNYSLGGSIVDPRLNLLQVTPLAPMNTTAYRSFTSSIILPPDLSIRINPEYSGEEGLLIVPDSMEHLHEGVEEIYLEFSSFIVKLLRFENYDFWSKVKSKFL